MARVSAIEYLKTWHKVSEDRVSEYRVSEF